MEKRDRTAAIIESTLRFLVGGGVIGASLLIPGLVIGLDKPFGKFTDQLDKRAHEREMRRVFQYMGRKGLIVNDPSREHGITITKRGRQRLTKSDFDNLKIKPPAKWDSKWRVVIFDIPEKYKSGRNALGSKLRELGFQPLQRSVWIHPFPCHEEIEIVAINYRLTRFITYLETSYIDKPEVLKQRFSHLIG